MHTLAQRGQRENLDKRFKKRKETKTWELILDSAYVCWNKKKTMFFKHSSRLKWRGGLYHGFGWEQKYHPLFRSESAVQKWITGAAGQNCTYYKLSITYYFRCRACDSLLSGWFASEPRMVFETLGDIHPTQFIQLRPLIYGKYDLKCYAHLKCALNFSHYVQL